MVEQFLVSDVPLREGTCCSGPRSPLLDSGVPLEQLTLRGEAAFTSRVSFAANGRGGTSVLLGSFGLGSARCWCATSVGPTTGSSRLCLDLGTRAEAGHVCAGTAYPLAHAAGIRQADNAGSSWSSAVSDTERPLFVCRARTLAWPASTSTAALLSFRCSLHRGVHMVGQHAGLVDVARAQRSKLKR